MDVGKSRHTKMCRDQNCVVATGAFGQNVLTFGCRGDMSLTCRQLSQPSCCRSTIKQVSMQTRLTHPFAALTQSCVRDYTLSLLLAFWKDFGCSKLIPKGSGTPVPDLVAQSHPCCGKTGQSKRLSSILIVQSRIRCN